MERYPNYGIKKYQRAREREREASSIRCTQEGIEGVAMGVKSRILVVGSTGNLGRLLVTASLAAGHPTFALARASAYSNPIKSSLLQSHESLGAVVLKGSLEDFDSLVEAVEKVDVVISAVSAKQTLQQELLIRAIKEVGSVKRFIPAEFGADPLKVSITGLNREFYGRRIEIRRLIEKEGIPYTYICCNLFMNHFLRSLAQPGLKAPPEDKVKIAGSGDIKAAFLKECDVANYTICTVDDPRSLNKTVYLRPAANICSMNDLVNLWELKIGKRLEREYLSEDQIVKILQGVTGGIGIYSGFIKGDHTNYDVDPSLGLDGIKLYPHVKHTTVEEYFDSLM